MDDGLERRTEPRYEFQKLGLAFGIFLPEGVAAEIPLRWEAKNISLKGLKFASNCRIALKESLRLHLYAPDDPKPIQLFGKVVRVEETDTGDAEKVYGIAVMFDEERSLDLKRLVPHLKAEAVIK